MIERVAFLSVHTSPLSRPGAGDAGGMNVYIDELAATLSRRGIAVDVFTRRSELDMEHVVPVLDRYRVVHVEVGPVAVGAEGLAETVGVFSEGVIKFAYTEGLTYDVVHSHYWLAGWAGVLVKEGLGIPLANSFHTLGRVKNGSRHTLDPLESLLRIRTEQDLVAQSDCVIASTPAEAQDLLDHYDASPERLCVSPPGVDHAVFSPGDRERARAEIGAGPGPLLLLAGRLQPLKGIDVAVAALAREELAGARLLVVGGPSGPGGAAEVARVQALSQDLGVAARVEWRSPVPHPELASYYQAADVVVVPSRAESFGMVAAEAQACGTPVVAAAVGGLRFAVADGEAGLLIDDHEPARYAAAIACILRHPEKAAAMSAAAVVHAKAFNWETSADRMTELYEGITA